MSKIALYQGDACVKLLLSLEQLEVIYPEVTFERPEPDVRVPYFEEKGPLSFQRNLKGTWADDCRSCL